ncbi:hypothetical protein JCM24511_08066 [Saitozyma sp. JCM 24511]|nr:hypothetical protein JCM24511_08066 [Saitozyma sp. JCM 24511]
MTNPVLSLPDATVERELFNLVRRERLARDTGDFTTLRSLYWDDSAIRVTWFEGTIDEFVDISRDQQQRGRGRGLHVITPVRCNVVKKRAVVESQGEIHIRPRIGGITCNVFNTAATLKLDAALLESGRPSYRHLNYLNRQAGYPVSADLPGDDRPDLVASFYQDADDWLNEPK